MNHEGWFGRSNFIGCMAISVNEIVEKKTLPLSWYKLLCQDVGKEQYSRIPNDEEVTEVWLLAIIMMCYMLFMQLKDMARKEDCNSIVRTPCIEISKVAFPNCCQSHNNIEDYTFITLLGKGSFGKVCICVYIFVSNSLHCILPVDDSRANCALLPRRHLIEFICSAHVFTGIFSMYSVCDRCFLLNTIGLKKCLL